MEDKTCRGVEEESIKSSKVKSSQVKSVPHNGHTFRYKHEAKRQEEKGSADG